MSAIPTIWFLLKLLWTHRTHLGNYASCNAGLTCQRTAQGQPGDWPSCDKSALTSSKLIWPGADCWQLIILAIPSSKEIQGKWGREEKSAGKEEGEKKEWFVFIHFYFCYIHLLNLLWTLWSLSCSHQLTVFSGYTGQSIKWTVTFCLFVFQCTILDLIWNNDSEVRLAPPSN